MFFTKKNNVGRKERGICILLWEEQIKCLGTFHIIVTTLERFRITLMANCKRQLTYHVTKFSCSLLLIISTQK